MSACKLMSSESKALLLVISIESYNTTAILTVVLV